MKVDFVFLVHARSSYDLRKKFAWLPRNERLLDQILKGLPILNAGTIVGLGGLKGVFLAVPMTASQMIKDRTRAVKKINQAYKIASKIGARCIGLGGYTGSISHNGMLVRADDKCAVTTGHAMTTYAVCNNAITVAKLSGRNLLNIKITIVGAAGSIGSGTFNYLKKHFRRFHLIDTRLEKLQQIKDHHLDSLDITISSDITTIINSNIVITATSAPYALINKELAAYISPGTVFIDDAQPIDVDRDLINQVEDILVIDGGVLHHDEVSYSLNLDMLEQGDFFGCMGEAMMVAKYGAKFTSIGNVTDDHVETMSRFAKDQQVSLAKFRCGMYPMDQLSIKKVISKWI